MLATTLRDWLPAGQLLSHEDWAPRHRFLTGVLVGHIPAVSGYALVTGNSFVHSVAEAGIPALLAIVAICMRSRLFRTLGVAFGLISCSAIFVHLSHGLIEWHFHYFVMLALISLYQEWRVYLLALAFVVGQHGLGSWLSFHSVYNHGNGELWWALVHGGFVLAASACHIAFWRVTEAANKRAESFRRQLSDGEHAVVARLEQTAKIRSDLIATASHEFRTPLTAIKGAATTLRQYGHRLSPEERNELLTAITTRSERLAQMLESMLVAAQVEPADLTARSSLGAAVGEVLAPLPGDLGTHQPIEVSLESDIWVACGRAPLQQLLDRLVENARRRAEGHGPIWLTTRRDGQFVSITVAAHAPSLDAITVSQMLEPFQRTSSSVDHPDLGLGLYVVRRVAEVHGGTLSARLEGERLVVEVTLPQCAPAIPAIPDMREASGSAQPAKA